MSARAGAIAAALLMLGAAAIIPSTTSPVASARSEGSVIPRSAILEPDRGRPHTRALPASLINAPPAIGPARITTPVHQPSVVPPPAARASRAAPAGAQLALINHDRAAAGLPPLVWNACLAGVALQNARRVAAQGFLSHTDAPSRDLACHIGTAAGENLAFLIGAANDAVANSLLMNSPPHRANIMGPYRYVGADWMVLGGSAYLAVEFD